MKLLGFTVAQQTQKSFYLLSASRILFKFQSLEVVIKITVISKNTSTVLNYGE